MNREQEENLDPRVRSALAELRGAISERYPDATFEVLRDPEEPENIDLLTTVDIEDPDEVLDLVIDRLVDLQVDERIPVHVIPVRTPERILTELRTRPSLRRRLAKISHGAHEIPGKAI